MNSLPPSEPNTVIPSVQSTTPLTQTESSRQTESPAGPPPADPRDRVTPDEFAVAPELLGKPLAKPMARGWAWLIDGAVIAALSQAGTFLLALALAALSYQLISKRKSFSEIKNGIGVPTFGVPAFGMKRLTQAAANQSKTDQGRASQSTPAPITAGSGKQTRAGKLPLILVVIFIGWAALTGLDWLTDQIADDEASAPETATELVAADTEPATEANSPEATAAAEELASLRAENRKLKAASERFSVLETARQLLDDVGFGFGWAAVYFSLLTAWWQGQTLGKKMLGLRVVQLNGKPLSVWDCFNRYGGYAAGFATGLLGFAQIFWDANRQAIHDKISFTVVVDDKRA